MTPDFAAYCGHGIAECEDCFGVAGNGSGLELSRFGEIVLLAQSVTMQNRPSKMGVVRRIALSDHWRWVSVPRWARVDFDLLAADEPDEDMARIGVEIRCQEGLRFELVRRIADSQRIGTAARRRENRARCRL
jgi:hypothetical protein